jgi:hypothetical protein
MNLTPEQCRNIVFMNSVKDERNVLRNHQQLTSMMNREATYSNKIATESIERGRITRKVNKYIIENFTLIQFEQISNNIILSYVKSMGDEALEIYIECAHLKGKQISDELLHLKRQRFNIINKCVTRFINKILQAYKNAPTETEAEAETEAETETETETVAETETETETVSETEIETEIETEVETEAVTEETEIETETETEIETETAPDRDTEQRNILLQWGYTDEIINIFLRFPRDKKDSKKQTQWQRIFDIVIDLTDDAAEEKSSRYPTPVLVLTDERTAKRQKKDNDMTEI